MNNREKLIKYLQDPTKTPNKVRQELSILVEDIVHGDMPDYDWADAFEDLWSKSSWEGWKDFRLPIRDILLGVGYYRVMTQKEIDNSYVTLGTVWGFKKKGIPYTSDEPFCRWIEK